MARKDFSKVKKLKTIRMSSIIERKGIILAGGHGSRLYPMTKSVPKSLLAIYDKPMIYYPITTLMQGHIREFLIISSPENKSLYESLLGNGEDWGISIEYAIQENPEGIAQAFIIAEEYIHDKLSVLILGDNIFHSKNLGSNLYDANNRNDGATVFAYEVTDPSEFGVVDIDSTGRAVSLEEKPKNPKSNFAVTGLYYYDQNVVEIAKTLKPSERGELEITDLNKAYMLNDKLHVEIMDQNLLWIDTGTEKSLMSASKIFENIEEKENKKTACPEEIAWRMGYISSEELHKLSETMTNSSYGQYLNGLIK